MAYTTIDDPSAYFQTKIYAGNNASNLVLTFDGNSDLQPDFLWQKQRGGATDHNLSNSVIGADQGLSSNTNEEEQDNGTGYIKSFQSDGFTVGNSDKVNASSSTNVAWAWKAGTSFTNDASGTGIGSIDSAGSVNNDAGFSIVTYTGNDAVATVKHGLSSAPKMMIIKDRTADTTNDWLVYHDAIGNTKSIKLNLTAAAGTDAPAWNNTSPTSSVFTIARNGNINGDGNTIVAYCFAEKQGYSKFGSYVANNGDGNSTFVYLGFKPAWIMVKKSSGTQSWYIGDNKRLGYNPKNENVNADSASAEFSQDNWDVLSNGFKIKNNGAGVGTDGDTYIYMAFAENPFVTSTGIPTTAR